MRLDIPFDLNASLCCGQVFRWVKTGDWWYGVIGEKVLKIQQCDSKLEFAGADEDFVRKYFSLNDDLDEISQCIGRDSYIQAALDKFKGLRIVRQVPWECLISFICATYKSIAAIELMLRKISEQYGVKKVVDGLDFYLFPSVEQLASANEPDLRRCGLGYRTKYVLMTAKKIYEEEIDLKELKAIPYLEARKKLLEFQGVGFKVADCVLLFSLGKNEAFPVDVWVKRVILNYYGKHFPPNVFLKMQNHESLTNSEYLKIGEFARSYFGQYAGYAQEYLYHYERTKLKNNILTKQF